MKIAIVEDEVLIAMFLKNCVEDIDSRKYEVLGTFDSYESIFSYLQEDSRIDLVFMDINLNSDKDGIQTACQLKKSYPYIEIVFITSFQDSATIQKAKRVAPLGYITKPIKESNIEAIMMVVDSKLNTNVSECLNVIDIVPYKYNTKSKELHLNSELIHLTKNEIICLETLVDNVNAYVTQDELIKNIWGDCNRVTSLREVIYRLRNKLTHIEIKNVSKVGYILKL
jgi:DNA-binding response OmpR family regulator